MHGFRNEADEPASILFAPGAPLAQLADLTAEQRRNRFFANDDFFPQ